MANLGEEFFFKLRAEDVRDPKNGWSKKMDNKSTGQGGPVVSFFQKTMPDTKLNMTCAEIFYPGLKIEAMKDFIMNIEKNKEMMQGVKKIDVMSRHENGYPEKIYIL